MTETNSPEETLINIKPSVRTEPSKRYVVIFHNDADGWGSCGIALNALTDPQRKYVTKAVNYTDDFSGILDELEPSDHVYVLGFSFRRDICDAIYEKVEKFIVLDHHKTAEKELEGAPYATFDMGKSGVLLTYEHFFDDLLSDDYESVPIPVRLLDNYDLWKKDDVNIGWSWVVGFHLFVEEHFGDFTFWRELMGMVDFPEATYNIIRQKALDFEVTIDEILKSAEFSKESFEGKNFAIYPCRKHISLIADAIRGKVGVSEHAPDFTASFFVKEDKVIVSLRGSDGFSVRLLAELLGGGGHDKAAGFSFDVEEDVDVAGALLSKLKQTMKLL